jgi:hypothetical protein
MKPNLVERAKDFTLQVAVAIVVGVGVAWLVLEVLRGERR